MKVVNAAAADLKNCLRDYRLEILRHKTTIVLGKRDRRFVAAIEIDMKKRSIKQAMARGNSEISPENTPELYAAYDKWTDENSIRAGTRSLPM